MHLDRRNPHKPFEPSLIEPFLDSRDVVSAMLLAAGKSNTNYKLVLSDGEVCVLRLYRHGSAKREVYVMSLVRDLVPVPVEIYRGESWSVFPFLAGELLDSVPEHSGAAAESLARIHSVAFASSGWIEADGSVMSFSFGNDKGFTETMLEHPDVLAWIGQETADSVGEIWEREAPRREALDAECCLVHGDFNPTNILIRDGKVSGILDWEFAHANTPYMDIGNLLRNTDPTCHGAIKRGLEAGGAALPDDWKERAALVDLGSHLEFLTSGRSDDFKRTCVERIEGFVRRFGGA